MLLQNKVALITGSGRGIGRAMAKLFAQEGARVFLAARTEAELSATAKEIVAAHGEAAYVTADLTREDRRRVEGDRWIAGKHRLRVDDIELGLLPGFSRPRYEVDLGGSPARRIPNRVPTRWRSSLHP